MAVAWGMARLAQKAVISERKGKKIITSTFFFFLIGTENQSLKNLAMTTDCLTWSWSVQISLSNQQALPQAAGGNAIGLPGRNLESHGPCWFPSRGREGKKEYKGRE